MKKEKSLDEFVKGVEMTVFPHEEQLLLKTGGEDLNISGNNVGYCPTVNNCNAGNCIKGCGA